MTRSGRWPTPPSTSRPPATSWSRGCGSSSSSRSADRTGDFYDGKRAAARYFFRWELPKVGPMLDLLASGDPTTLEMRDAWF